MREGVILILSSPFGAVKMVPFFSTASILFDRKVNLVGAFGRSKFSRVFKKTKELRKKRIFTKS